MGLSQTVFWVVTDTKVDIFQGGEVERIQYLFLRGAYHLLPRTPATHLLWETYQVEIVILSDSVN